MQKIQYVLFPNHDNDRMVTEAGIMATIAPTPRVASNVLFPNHDNHIEI